MSRCRGSYLAFALLLAACSSGGPGTGGDGGEPGSDGGPVVVDGGGILFDGGPRDGGDAGTVILPPDVIELEVQRFSPPRGPATGGTPVTFVGRGFVAETTVTIGGAALTDVQIDAERTLTGKTPPGVPGVAPVIVENSGARLEVPGGFTYFEGVSLGEVTPPNGPTAGGTEIVIDGTGLLPASVLLVGGRPAISIQPISISQLRAVTPPGDPGPVDVSVVNANGAATRIGAFTYVPALALGAVSPPAGPLAGGNDVHVLGSGFDPGAQVYFGAVRAGSVTFVSSADLAVRVPAGAAPGPVDVAVTGAGGDALLAGGYAYFGSGTATAIEAVVPAHGPTSGGTTIRLVGTGLAGASEVRVGGALASGVVVESGNVVRAVTPPGSAGAADVSIVAAGGNATLAGGFRYDAPFSISQVEPPTGPASGGTRVTVTGEGFTAGVQVSFGPLAAPTVELVDAETLRVVTPPGSAGPVDVVVRDGVGPAGPSSPGGARTATLAGGFSYFDVPRVAQVSPARGAIAGGTLVTLRGAGFTAASRPFFNGSPAVDVHVAGPSLLTARTPPGEIGLADVAVVTEHGMGFLPYAYDYFDPASSFGGTAGGPIDGSVNVTVLSGQGLRRLPGAFATLAVGGTAFYQGITDFRGQVTFSGPDLHGAQTVTAGKEGFNNCSIVAFDAENVTVVVFPQISTSVTGTPPPLGTVKGIIKAAFKAIPPPPDGWVKALLVTTTMADRYSPNAGAALYYTDDGREDRPYELTTRTGNLAVYALAGHLKNDSSVFVPLQMGMHRYLFVDKDATLEGIDIVMNNALTATLDAPLLHAPPISAMGPSAYRMTVYMEMGVDGTAFFYQTAESRDEPRIRHEHLPVLTAIPDATLTAIVGAYTLDDFGNAYAPLAVYTRYGIRDLQSPVELGPFVGIGTPIEPLPEAYLSRNRFQWNIDTPPVPDFTLVYVLEPVGFGLSLNWEMIVPGTVTEVDFPDLAALGGLHGMPASTVYYWEIFPVAGGPPFDINAFTYRDLNSGAASTYSVSSYTFQTP